jgi:hypothetical protein
MGGSSVPVIRSWHCWRRTEPSLQGNRRYQLGSRLSIHVITWNSMPFVCGRNSILLVALTADLSVFLVFRCV